MTKLIDKALNLVGLQRKTGGRYKRSYAAGYQTRLTSDWNPNTLTPDKAVSEHIITLRSRARQLEKDNRYVKRWLSSLENNCLSYDGINLQMKVRFNTGRFDTSANNKIEDAWTTWGARENCCLNREDDWISVQKLVLRSAARDGGLLVRLVRGRDVNPFGLALDLVEIDYLDTTFTERFTNGNEVRLGVERNRQQQVVAYWILQAHPGDMYPMIQQTRADRIRVPALGTNPTGDEWLHYYVKDRVGQSVGVPWLTAAMLQLHNLDEYQLAELMQSRAAAEKGGWFENPNGEQWTGDLEQTTDETGNIQETNRLMDFEKGAFEELPPGVKFVPWDPTHPNPPFGDYVKSVLHGISAGLNIDYATLTGDLSQNSFSSTKAGRLEIQEEWKKVQGHFITNFCIPVFSNWLEMAMLSGAVNLPLSKFDTLNKPKFRGRRWPWVDPQKDVDAAATALEAKIRTRTDIIAENGGDFEDTVDQLKLEKELMEEAGILDKPKPPPPPAAMQPPEPPKPEDEETE